MYKPVIVFVHGTGVRKEENDKTLSRIQSHLKSYGFDVKEAPWGDLAGSRAAEKSIPTFAETGGRALTAEDRQARLWSLLFADPASELRLLALNKPDQTLPKLAAVLDDATWALYKPDIKAELLGPLGLHPKAPSPVSFLPYLSGERTPHDDPDVRGMLEGLSHGTDRGAIVQAVLELDPKLPPAPPPQDEYRPDPDRWMALAVTLFL